MNKIIYSLFALFLISCSSATINDNYNSKEKESYKTKDDVSTGKDNISSNYTDKDVVVDSLKDNTITTNNVYVFEALFNKKLVNEAISKLGSNLVENVSTITKENTSSDEHYSKDASHGIGVVKAFLDLNGDFKDDNNYTNTSKIKLGSFEDIDFREGVSGIINMSYGFNEYISNMGYLNSDSEYIEAPIYKNNRQKRNIFGDNFSNLLFDKNYVNNNQLKISSLGNTEDTSFRSFYSTNLANSMYQVMSPEMQKLSRSEVIFVKNIINDKLKKEMDLGLDINKNTYTTDKGKYYEFDWDDENNAKALLLRSNTVSMPGFIKYNGEYEAGSSFSAPKVTRLAYEIKKKYPFLTYHQIKQVILTTSDTDNSGYLNNLVGWGVVNVEKALNGFSNFNAGLIEEQKFFNGMYDKIYDSEKNIYEYINIPYGKYEFSNDISTGLSGDGNSKEYDILKINGTYTPKNENDEKNEPSTFLIRVPKVLDSEKNIYANVAKAGLRKAGSGELVLSGRQLYDTKTQVLGGILTLKNSSNSNYEVFSNSTLNLSGVNADIKDITNDGKVNFLSNTNLNNYKASDNSTTQLNYNAKIKANSFISSGYIGINVSNNEKINPSELISANFLNLDSNKLRNPYLSVTLKNNKAIISKNNSRTLEELSKEELRNIPSYLINENRFFDEYLVEDEEDEEDETTPSNPISNSIYNLQADDKQKAREQLFTDNYSTYASSLFEINDDISNNLENSTFKKIDKNTNLYYNNLISTNVLEDTNFTRFSHRLFANTLGIDYRVNDNISLGTLASIYNGEYLFKNDANFKNQAYQIALKLKYEKNDWNISNILAYTRADAKINRKLSDTEFSSNLASNLLEYDLNISKKFDYRNNEISPYLDIRLLGLNVEKSKEISDGTYSDMGVKINNNNILKQNIGVGVNIKTKLLDNLDLRNNIKASMYLDDNLELNADILNKNINLKGRSLNKYNLIYNLGLDYRINKEIKINLEASVKSNKKISLSTTINYEF